MVGGARPALVVRPGDYDPRRAYPLVVLLHGYAANGFVQDIVFGTSARVDAQQYLLLIPEGELDGSGKQYWNAGPCCSFGTDPPDDLAYLRALVEEVATTHHVDRRSIHALGHSNGGFMALALACEASDLFASVASLAGSAPPTELDCSAPERPVSVLQVHGDADDVVLYDGVTVPTGIPLAAYPSAPETVRRFAARLGCDVANPPTPGTALDIDADLVGVDTTVAAYVQGCPTGTTAELWTIQGAGHIPYLREEARDRLLAWLFDHRR